MPTASLKKLSISNEIRNDGTLCSLVERAIELLIGELGQSVDTAEACWTTHIDDLSQRIVQLLLSDWSGSVVADFSEGQLADVRRLQWRLGRLWGDLLQIRSHRQLARLHEVVQGLSDD